MVKTICVCGAGTMGSGIAQIAAQSGCTTILFDVNTAMLEKSKLAMSKNLEVLVSKGRLTSSEKEEAFSRIQFIGNIDECKADIIIEAIVEKLEAKIELFNSLARLNSPETIFATNTSSLPVSQIAKNVEHQNRIAGLHFFNPAPVMKLVEVVKGDQTSDEVITSLCALAEKLGKTPVVCKDAPGFIVNRVARHYYLEALKLVEQGITDVATIDAVLEGCGFKMGPFKLMDLIGMDINYSVSNIVWEALGKPERLQPSPLQKAKVDARELGKKTGKGFYEYN
jgi:3-hydroxybutyryl-CoA dehydrogenase